MKFPNHIILDVSRYSNLNTSQYWIYRHICVESFTPHNQFFTQSLQNFFIFKKNNIFLNELIKNQQKFTLKFNTTNPAFFLNDDQKNHLKKIFNSELKIKHGISNFNNYHHFVYNYIINEKKKFNEKKFTKILKSFKFNNQSVSFKNNNLWNFFDINFIRKEKIYTKLKYSRVPQYDIVSGGVAALFAGFLGFLICEKFGFELLDSGDFYTFVMYLVFGCFFTRPFIKIFTTKTSTWSPFSFKWFFFFYKNLINLFLNRIKHIFF